MIARVSRLSDGRTGNVVTIKPGFAQIGQQATDQIGQIAAGEQRRHAAHRQLLRAGGGHLEAQLGQGAEEARQVHRGDVDGDVVALDAVAFQPVIVQRWAAAVGDGVAEDGGKRDAGMVGHRAIMPLLPSQANSGRSGRPSWRAAHR